MRGSVSVCLHKGRQIEKRCINFFEESGLNATLSFFLFSNILLLHVTNATHSQKHFLFYESLFCANFAVKNRFLIAEKYLCDCPPGADNLNFLSNCNISRSTEH